MIFATPFSGIWHIILLVVFFNNKKRNIRGTFYFTDGFIVTLVHTCKGKYKTCLILVPSSDVLGVSADCLALCKLKPLNYDVSCS